MLDTADETDWLRRHLVKHVASNICESNVTKFDFKIKIFRSIRDCHFFYWWHNRQGIENFFTRLCGIFILVQETKKWTWKTGAEIDKNDDLCLEDYQTGDCVGLTWNLQLGCR